MQQMHRQLRQMKMLLTTLNPSGWNHCGLEVFEALAEFPAPTEGSTSAENRERAWDDVAVVADHRCCGVAIVIADEDISCEI